jgi:hypothetical protein
LAANRQIAMLKAAMAGFSQRLAVIWEPMGAVMEGIVEAFIEAVMVALMQRAPIKLVNPIKWGKLIK